MIQVKFTDNDTGEEIASVALAVVPVFQVGSYLGINQSDPNDVLDVSRTTHIVTGVKTHIDATSSGCEDSFRQEVFVKNV